MNFNRSYRVNEAEMLKEKEEELALFFEMRRHEKERQRGDDFLLNSSAEFDAPLVSDSGASAIYDIVSSAATRKTGADDFLNSDNEKNDYEWLLSPPGTPLFPSLEMESQKTMMSQIGTPKALPTATKSKLTIPQKESPARSNLASKSRASLPGSVSSAGLRRPSSSGGPGSRPGTPSGRPSSSTASRSSRPSTPASQGTLSSTRPAASVTRSTVSAARSTNSTMKPASLLTKSTVPSKYATPSRSAVRSSTPSRSSAISSTPSRSTVVSSTPSRSISVSSTPSSTPSGSISVPSTPSRSTVISSTPSRSTARASTPSRSTVRGPTPSTSTARASTPSRSTARSSTPTSRPSAPQSPLTPSRSTARASTPTRRPSTPSTAPSANTAPIRSTSSVSKTASSTAKNLGAPPGTPTVKSRPWKPSEMPGFSLDAPPNLRTTLADRPLSATRGRPGTSSRSTSVEPASIARARRQSCSPSRGRLSNGKLHASGSSVPAVSRHQKVNDNVSPVVIGTKMVERVINMRKLAPPKPEDQHSPKASGKVLSSPDSSGFGRTLSKKSLDMAIRHMDIRTFPGNLRPLMSNIPASSMYSVRSGPTRSKSVSVSDSPLATSSNASSEPSVNNNGICLYRSEVDDEISSETGGQSPAIVQGR